MRITATVHNADRGKQHRAAVANRLGLPADSSNAAIFAAIDAVKSRTADDELYTAAFGSTTDADKPTRSQTRSAAPAARPSAPAAPRVSDETLYAMAFGDDTSSELDTYPTRNTR